MNVIKIYSFVGMANYYHCYVKYFAVIASHLTLLTQEDFPFELDNKCEESFQKLKIMLTLALVLTLPVEGKDFIIIW